IRAHRNPREAQAGVAPVVLHQVVGGGIVHADLVGAGLGEPDLAGTVNGERVGPVIGGGPTELVDKAGGLIDVAQLAGGLLGEPDSLVRSDGGRGRTAVGGGSADGTDGDDGLRRRGGQRGDTERGSQSPESSSFIPVHSNLLAVGKLGGRTEEAAAGTVTARELMLRSPD